MSLPNTPSPPIGYIAYIDEAGDDGLRSVKPTDPNGASEWMVLSCVLVRASRESEVLPWLKDIIKKIDQHQITYLHYRQLRHDKKLLACKCIADLPIRLFVVLSNKRNMEGYNNIRAAQSKMNASAWFYCWLSRVLLERVSDFCNRKSVKHYGETRAVRFEFSTRGGVKINNFIQYIKYLKDQDDIGLLFNDCWVPSWQVIDFDHIYTYQGKERAGLQLADCVASAFYQGVELNRGNIVRPQSAIALETRMCRSKRGKIFDFGVKVLPRHAMSLVLPQQRNLLDFYSQR